MSDNKRSEAIKEAESLAEAIQDKFEENLNELTRGFGICSTCKHLRVVETQYGRYVAECCMFYEGAKIRPNRIDPITRCSRFWNKAWTEFKDLQDLAILIDPNKEKTGFIK